MKRALPLLLLLVAGCAGMLARQHTLAGPIDQQSADVVKFAAPSDTVTLFSDCVKQRDWNGALAVWPLVQESALEGIKARPESEGVKDSFREQVTRLDALLRKAVAHGQ